MYARILQHISAVEVQEYTTDHDHLPAMSSPAVVHAFKEHLPIHTLCEELLDVGLYMRFY